MNILDIIILIPVAWFGFKGLKNGLIRELASIAALVLGVWATLRFSDYVATKLGNTMAIKAVAFVLTFFAVLVAVHFAGILVEKVVKLVIPGWLNNIFGLLFGAAKALLVVSVLLYFVTIVDFKEMLLKPEVKEKSLIYKYTEPIVPSIMQYVGKEEGAVDNPKSC